MSTVTGLAPRSVAVVLGTRPGQVKLAPLIRLLGPAALVIHSGQHYDPANTDPLARLAAVLDALAATALPVLVPLHPRTRRRIRELGLDPGRLGIRTCDPPPYPAFLALMERARVLISDSGGIQEEATIIGRPLIVLRKSTERPEALSALVRIAPSPDDLPGLTADLITMPAAGRTATPFGDGLASQRISRAITTLLGDQPASPPRSPAPAQPRREAGKPRHPLDEAISGV